MTKTHWRKIITTNYLGGFDLDDGKGGYREITATIKNAVREKVKDQTGSESTELVLHFQENLKPMILNVTNTKTIEFLSGSAYIEDWSGLQIMIGTDKVNAFGEIHNALRIRRKKVKSDKKAVTCTDCEKTVPDRQGVKGTVIAEAYKEKYGVPLCFDCGQKRKAGEQDAKPE